ncbi:MAG TPA: hypothetical protein VHZ52_17960 [Acidobacteriaceae bacterium]|jgi:hypothetical protein|nr:hypothetical protein [Acidobacteriaceae bacterium]
MSSRAIFPRQRFPALRFLTFLLSGILVAPSFASAQPASTPAPLSPEETQSLVQRVLAVEMQAAEDPSHPMQYRLRKSSPRFNSTKLIVETKDGDVARLIAINDNPLSPQDEQTEEARLQSLVNDPSLQRHRQAREQGDSDRARKIIRALPSAFLYTFAGFADTPQGVSYRLSFQPNPGFDPQDLEAQALKGMAGELWIDAAQQRVTRLQGKRIHDVDYGWGLFGKLDQGGTLLLEQADIGDHQWRTTHMVLVMNARLLIKSVKLDTTLDLSQFIPVASGMTYQQAIQMLDTRAKEISAAPLSPTPNAAH